MEIHKRSRERSYPDDGRVAWGDTFGGELAPAKVRDISETGIGLLVAGDVGAHMGDAIRVLSGDEEYARRARIVRIATLREGSRLQTTIGCRWLTNKDTRERWSHRRAHRHHQHTAWHEPA